MASSGPVAIQNGRKVSLYGVVDLDLPAKLSSIMLHVTFVPNSS